MTPGLMIAAPASGSGKTTVTLGLARAFTRQGLAVQCLKGGPDYIDPGFHAAATGRPSCNLDSWTMPAGLIGRLAGAEADLAILEGSMGLFDGVATTGACGNGSGADLAAMTGWPVVLVLDCSGQAQTAGALAQGMARFRPGVQVAGVILNRIASPRHERLARRGIEEAGLPVLGVLPRNATTTLPERHLGLVQAQEHAGLAGFLEDAADLIAAHCDMAAIRALARQARPLPASARAAAPAPGRAIALAQDAAFSFVYAHLLADWAAQGARVLPFSPLADEAPPAEADACWLPGGYPELHAARLAAAGNFRAGLRAFAETRPVHGECGGYMAMGAWLTDAGGARHRMAGLLGLETSFARRKMHLGYRRAELVAPMPGLPAGTSLRGHEFHYATILAQPDAPLARVHDADGTLLAETGAFRAFPGGGRASGSFFHLIAAEP